VHQQSNGGGGRKAVVRVGTYQDGIRMGTDHVRGTERVRAVVCHLQAASEAVLPAVAA